MAASTAAAAAPGLSRSAYVARIRRAFLLRAHPDRFRSRPPSVRRGQAELVQAISERMSSPDFVAYSRPDGVGETASSAAAWRAGSTFDGIGGDRYDYFLERRDGSLLRRTMRLDDTVEGVLKSMADALLSSGAPAASIPAPPPPPPPPARASPDEVGTRGAPREDPSGRWAWATPPSSSSSAQPRSPSIDHRFDVNTRRGRDLLRFLRSDLSDPSEIERRRSRRIDAHSAALAARRAFGFLSVDGTGVGWSSESLAACLGRLAELRDEYGDQLRVRSFYPLRLVVGYGEGYSDALDEFRDSLEEAGGAEPSGGLRGGRTEEAEARSRAVDLYGGTVTLHPSATSLQWLRALTSVTEESIATYKANADRLRGRTETVQDALNVQVRRGKTCPPREYHDFMERLADALAGFEEGGSNTSRLPSTTSSGLALERAKLTVETDQVCRRGKVTKEGTVRVGAGMSPQSVLRSLSRLGDEARKRASDRAEREARCREAINLTKAELSLTNIYRVALSSVTADQTIECLHRLLRKVRGQDADDGSGEEMRYHLAGQVLGVTGSGRLCHLGDDGSIVIPCDWR